VEIKTKLFRRTSFLGWLMLVAGLIGFVASFILTVEKMHLLQDPSASFPCNLNPIISCGSVMKTAQASVFGFANSLIGVGAFAALAALGVAQLAGAQFKRWLWQIIQIGMLFGLGFVHWLFFESVYRIGSLCPYCMVVWAVTITTAWYITLFNLQNGHIRIHRKLNGVVQFMTRRHSDILIVWFIILTALILYRFWYYFGGFLS
jgi:uncharacterized membrane protein